MSKLEEEGDLDSSKMEHSLEDWGIKWTHHIIKTNKYQGIHYIVLFVYYFNIFSRKKKALCRIIFAFNIINTLQKNSLIKNKIIIQNK